MRRRRQLANLATGSKLTMQAGARGLPVVTCKGVWHPAGWQPQRDVPAAASFWRGWASSKSRPSLSSSASLSPHTNVDDSRFHGTGFSRRQETLGPVLQPTRFAPSALEAHLHVGLSVADSAAPWRRKLQRRPPLTRPASGPSSL